MRPSASLAELGSASAMVARAATKRRSKRGLNALLAVSAPALLAVAWGGGVPPAASSAATSSLLSGCPQPLASRSRVAIRGVDRADMADGLSRSCFASQLLAARGLGDAARCF